MAYDGAKYERVITKKRHRCYEAQAKFDGTRYQLAHNLENGGVPVQPSLSQVEGENVTHI